MVYNSRELVVSTQDMCLALAAKHNMLSDATEGLSNTTLYLETLRLHQNPPLKAAPTVNVTTRMNESFTSPKE